MRRFLPGKGKQNSMGAASAADTQDERGKVFLWAKDRGGWIHLIAFLLFSGLIHGSGFYFFKVVYPSPLRAGKEPDSITLMDATNPAVRTVLQRISDRTIFLLPPSGQTEVRIGLETRPVRFTPAFQRAELELLKPPPEASMPGDIMPLEFNAGEETVETRVAGFPVKLDPGLAERPVAPWSIMHDYLSAAVGLPLLHFDLEIAPGGEVRVTGVEAELGTSEKADLARVIESTLRFTPSSQSNTGWIEIGGEN